MSDNYGFDFDNNGKVSFEESLLTYKIERDTARNNSLYDALSRHSASQKSSVTYTSVSGSKTASSTNVQVSADNDIRTPDSDSTTAKKPTHIKLTVFIVIAVIALIMIIGVFAAGNIGNKQHIPDVNGYNSVIRLIQDGEYREAINRIKYLNDNDFNDLEATHGRCIITSARTMLRLIIILRCV